MVEKKEKDWFKLKRYPHIGLPLRTIDRSKWIENYVTSPTEVAKHSFLPFIHKTAQVRKFRKVYSEDNGQVHEDYKQGNQALRGPMDKKRELFYASHLDSLIYGYYAKILSEHYERKIKSAEYNLDEVVTAYRSIPVNPRRVDGSNKCNIDFANDVFKFIANYNSTEFAVISFDISNFFDSLNHKKLREFWQEVLDVERLPPDHFNVFKNITRFSYVDIVDIFEIFKDQIFTQKLDAEGNLLPLKRKKVDRLKYLRNQDAVAFCTEEEFFKVKGKLLQPSKTKKLKNGSIVYRDFGIPQGSPISSVLANIYMLHFDRAINKFVTDNGGIYRRYSDDMVVVSPLNKKEEVRDLVCQQAEYFKLEIQEAKTQVFHFKREDNKLHCGQEFKHTINWNKNFIYLGFEFDGNTVLLKSASLSGYYRKMKGSLRQAKYYSSRKYATNRGVIFKRRQFKRFSYKGAKRTRKYLWNEAEKRFIKSDKYNWGNFLSYANKASNVMIKNKIRNQTERHWNILNKLMKR